MTGRMDVMDAGLFGRCELVEVSAGVYAYLQHDGTTALRRRFQAGTPFMFQGSIAGAIETLDELEHLGAETIVPGHGSVCGPEVLGDVRRYLQFVQGVAARGVAAGVSPLEAALESDLGEFADLLDSERIVGNLYRACVRRRARRAVGRLWTPPRCWPTG